MTIQTAALIALCGIGVSYLFLKLGRNGGTALLLLIAPIVGIWMLVHSFQAFDATTKVATIQASPIVNQPHTMAIAFTSYDNAGNPTHAEYELSGDRWELSADVVNFQPWVNLLGVSNGFQLSRLTSQYDDSNAHSVQPVELPHNQAFSIPFVERSHYTGGVIMPADGTTYNIFVTLEGQMFAQHA